MKQRRRGCGASTSARAAFHAAGQPRIYDRASAFWEKVSAGRDPTAWATVREVHQSGAPKRLQEWVAGRLRAGLLARLAVYRADRRFAAVLDAGCGLGDWALAFALTAREVLAFDINPAFVECGARKARAAGLDHCQFRVGRMDELLSLAGDRRFDLLVFAAVFSLLDDPELTRVLSQARSLATDGAIVYVRASVSNRHYEQRLYGEFVSVYRRPERYEQFFLDAGLRVLGHWTSGRLVLEGHAAVLPGPAARGLRVVIEPLARAADWMQRATNPVGFHNWLMTPTS